NKLQYCHNRRKNKEQYRSAVDHSLHRFNAICLAIEIIFFWDETKMVTNKASKKIYALIYL
ncbi:hypothetical protein ACJX0J_033131, partial [Zea mays]